MTDAATAMRPDSDSLEGVYLERETLRRVADCGPPVHRQGDHQEAGQDAGQPRDDQPGPLRQRVQDHAGHGYSP